MINEKKIIKNLKPIKFIAVPRLLDHLGVAQYSKYTKAIKELIANGYDADAIRVNIWVSSEDEILIVDNGEGMNEQEIREGYMLIGSDHKRKLKRTQKFNRLPIGSKGVGKLAGLGIAKVMEIETTKDGKKYSFTIDRDEIEKKDKLEEAFINIEVEEVKEKCGTIVKLTSLLPHVKKIIATLGIRGTAKRLREFLATSLPQDPNFKIYVNDILCKRTDVPYNKKYKIPDDLKKLGIKDYPIGYFNEENKKGHVHPGGIIKVARKTVLNPGIITTVRGSAIGNPTIFDLNKGSHKFVHHALITGMIEVSEFDPEERSDTIPVIQTDREGFNEDHPKYIAYNEFMTDVLKGICRIEEKDYSERRKAEVEAKVKDAIKNVTEVFNDYHKETVKITRKPKTKSKVDEKGREDIWTGSPKSERKRKISNPVGITNDSLKKKLKAIVGEGNIKLGNKTYKITTDPKGIDGFECQIEDSIMVININTDHPAYEHSVLEKSTEMTVFRAIASTWAYKVCTENNLGVEPMYEKIDELTRFHAEWAKKKRGIKTKKVDKEVEKQIEISKTLKKGFK